MLLAVPQHFCGVACFMTAKLRHFIQQAPWAELEQQCLPCVSAPCLRQTWPELAPTPATAAGANLAADNSDKGDAEAPSCPCEGRAQDRSCAVLPEGGMTAGGCK